MVDGGEGLGDDLALWLGDQLSQSPLLRDAHRPPGLCEGVVSNVEKAAQEKGGGADKVDHLGD